MEQRTVTFLFTDIEDSTALWERNAQAMSDALRQHDTLVREAVERYRGTVFKTIGDAFCTWFVAPDDACLAAVDAQIALAGHDWPDQTRIRCRMAVHTGEAGSVGDDWFGPTVNRVARILSLGHGGQILLSGATHALANAGLKGTVTDLGEHALKGMAQPERVYQLAPDGLPAEFAPLSSSSVGVQNLPHEVTSFVGRDRVTAEASSMLESNRLVTFTGSGGVGKTRLAVHLASQVAGRFGDGVGFVDLSRLAEATEVPNQTLVALGMRDKTGKDPLGLLTEKLAHRESLLLIDNCEHVVEKVAEMVDALLRRCSKITVLATSREPLRVSGEAVLRIPSLGLPAEDGSFEQLATSEAVQLFVHRARSSHHAFEVTRDSVKTIAAICRQLDGIPLAIELAAARLRTMSLEDILERLRDRFRLLVAGDRTATPRQKTLRATIEWSTGLLTAQERLIFDRLSVFRGGWSMEAAEVVCSDETLAAWDVFDQLSSLVDKSLVVLEDAGRFRFLESLRQIAEENLALQEGEPERSQQSHVRYFADWVGNARPELEGPNQSAWFTQFDAERDNLLAAFDYASHDPDVIDLGRTMAWDLARFWMTRGTFGAIFPRYVALGGALPQEPSKALAGVRSGTGLVAFGASALGLSIKYFHLARETFLAIGDDTSASALTSNLATVSFANCDVEEAWELGNEVLAKVKGKEPRSGEAAALGLLGTIALKMDRPEEAFEFATRSVDLWRVVRSQHGIAVAVNNLGHAALALGRPDEGEKHYRESISLRTSLNDRQGLIWSLEAFAKLATARGDYERGAFLTGAAVRIRVDFEIPILPADQADLDRSEAKMVDGIGRERFERFWQIGHGAGLDKAVEVALEGSPITA